MITEDQLAEAIKQRDAASEIVRTCFKEKQEAFHQRLKDEPIFTDDELYYSARNLCECGHGLAYPKACGPGHYWDCSAILKGIADKAVTHTGQLPFAFYDIKGESDTNGTTRGVFRPRKGPEEAKEI